MAEIAQRVARQQETIGPFLVVAVILGLVGLPLAAWLDLRDLSDRIVRSQANEIGKIIDDMRAFYASDVVGRVLAAHGGPIRPTHNYRDVDGGNPDPGDAVDRAREPH